MGTATLETKEGSLSFDRGDEAIKEGDFNLWHTNNLSYDIVAVRKTNRAGEIFYIWPGETIEIPGLGRLRHQQ